MLLLFLVLMLMNHLCICSTKNDVTVIKRNILSRKKRYLVFPKGSTLVIQLSAIKAIQQAQPRGWNFLEELEFPFFLPDDPNMFRRKNRNRREVYATIKNGLTKYGFDGRTCIDNLICDIKQFTKSQKTSMNEEILFEIFRYLGENTNFEEVCTGETNLQCSYSILQYFLQGINILQ
ncbi:uncharacterized protein LOC114329642 [Diabrotica virgifera virgifera]|uniref:Uncharacterized protein LOC114329642 n=1 Tax=Diabrotica virgifera virgifera TaxID=50390 RepID=A0A6P7FNU2_DIAVI|nr:uncharacterized protein LOC114329642 [Diabrotica virgifera virgifera]